MKDKNLVNLLLFPIAFALCCVPAASQTCLPAPVGLVSWWQGETDTLDSRSRNAGTLINGATFVSGNVGQVFQFDNTNNQHILVPTVPLGKSRHD